MSSFYAWLLRRLIGRWTSPFGLQLQALPRHILAAALLVPVVCSGDF